MIGMCRTQLEIMNRKPPSDLLKLTLFFSVPETGIFCVALVVLELAM